MPAKRIYWPDMTTIERIEEETPDTRTYFLAADGIGWRGSYQPGQFVELSVFGAGEAPFCLCQSVTRARSIEVTVRKTGSLTDKLHLLKARDVVGLRGPFGNSFPCEEAKGKDLIFVGGGIGLPPLRSFLNYVLDHRKDYGDVHLLYGARTPADLVYKKELAEWQKSDQLHVAITVDKGDDGWKGRVGLVTELVKPLKVNPASTMAFTCGPPIMLKFMVAELQKLGLENKNIVTTLERYMKCGIGKCGHCCIGQHYVCADGPVYNFEQIRHLPEKA